MRTRWSALVLAVALLAGACTSGRVDPATLTVVDGQVQVAIPGGWQPATTVTTGQQVRATEETLLRRQGEEVTLLADTVITLDAQRLRLVRGDVTVRSATASVTVDDAIIDTIGIVRVQAGVTPRIAVYAGTADVGRPGESQRVAELRQLVLTPQRFDGTDQPLAYDDADPIDREHLMPAIAFDREVARYTATLAEQYGRAPRPPTFYTTFTDLSGDEAAALAAAAVVTDETGLIGPPSETLVGLFVARAVAAADDAGIREAAAQVAGLRREGARWGLIAMALRLEQVVFAATVDTAVAVREDFVASAPAQQPRPGPPAGASTPIAPPAPPVDVAPPPPPDQPPPAPEPPPEDPPEPELVPEAVEALIEEVLGQDGLDLQG